MATPINRKTLEYLAELSRIGIGGERQGAGDQEEKLLKDLQKILAYFEELKEVDTENVEPMAGGTMGKNVFRDDEAFSERKKSSVQLTGQFPAEEGGYLKIPPVFE